jgi:uncharacterized protein (UPF0332 family)
MLSDDLKQHSENNKHSGKKYLFDQIIPNVEELEKQLERFQDALIDDIINTPDDEILQEVKEEYVSSDYEANRFREILRKVYNDKKAERVKK